MPPGHSGPQPVLRPRTQPAAAGIVERVLDLLEHGPRVEDVAIVASAAGEKEDCGFLNLRSWDLPILDHEASNPAELGRVVGNQGAALCQRNRVDQHVIAADEQSPLGQVRTNPAVLFGGGIIERKRNELLP